MVFYRVLLKLCSISPRFKRFFWRQCYQFLAGRYSADYWTFMNYGYAPTKGDLPLSLNAEDESDRYFIELYYRVAGAIDLIGCEVMEVGSGRGGGASFVARYLYPTRMVGVDISDNAVALCRARHAVDTLTFEQGDAEHLPFEDASFDVVINIESSHCYGSVSDFFAEVFRVLRPGGHFLFADFRSSHDVDALHKQLCDVGFLTREEVDITPQVCEALDVDSEHKRDLIRSATNNKIVPSLEQLAGLKGSRMFENLHNGTWCYVRFVLQKPEGFA